MVCRSRVLDLQASSWRGAAVFLFATASGACSIESVEGAPGVGRVGDPCADWEFSACTADGTEELVCDEGWYEFVQSCEGGCEVFTVLTDKTLLACYDENGSPKDTTSLSESPRIP